MKKIELYKSFLNSKRPIQKSILSRIENTLKNDFIYNSNAIEGNSLTRQETEVILEYGVTVKGKPLKDHLEVKGQEYAINFLNNIIKENEVLSLRLIKEFHALILGPVDPEIAGQFKKFKNKIVGSSFETSDPIFVEEDLEKILKDYFSSTENAIEKIAKFHANFEKIHPFSDGNGRTGRLVMNFELMKAGYPICIIKNEDRLEYYNSLNEAQANNNYNEIIKFVEENLEKTFEFYFEHISNNWQEEFENKWLGVGGKLEKGETPEQCLIREVKEETGLDLIDYVHRGIVIFNYNDDEPLDMYLYTSKNFSGEIQECSEGDLKWIDKSEIYKLNLWEGDRIFLELLEKDTPFFHLILNYENDNLLSSELKFVEK